MMISDGDFDELMTGLRGGVTTEEARALCRMAAEVVTGCIVEVGSFRGKSAVALALGVRANTSSNSPKIYCIEPHRPFTGVYGGKFGPDDRGAFFEVMLRTGAFQEVALLNCDSEQVAPNWREPVGLAFIDGDHRYPAVRKDFMLWDDHILPGGLLVFDDAKDPSGGVRRLVSEILAERAYEYIGMIGKMAVLQKKYSRRHCKVPTRSMRILVACDIPVLSGGFMRFERVGTVLVNWGHTFAFVALSKEFIHQRTSRMGHRVLTFKEADAETWDAVMVPGAGFPDDTIARLSEFRAERFGVRIQHILNDQSRRDTFLDVNRSFDPQVVIFNNHAWPAGSYTDFRGDRFHVLLGAVDPVLFRPPAYRCHPVTKGGEGRWIIGGQAGKNPEPLIAALRLMPDTVSVVLFGDAPPEIELQHGDLLEVGRLKLIGPLCEGAMANFYRQVDCIVMTETAAGWANIVAEALASGTPAVCTRVGTTAFARDGETVLIVDPPEPQAILEAVRRLQENPALCNRLAEAGRSAVMDLNWERYARQLLVLLPHDGYQHYTFLPESGLHGKWPLHLRLDGLEPLLAEAGGKSVVDFGAAEGVIAHAFLSAGANTVHGFERDPNRVAVANALCADWPSSRFHVANLSSWDTFEAGCREVLDSSYDITAVRLNEELNR